MSTDDQAIPASVTLRVGEERQVRLPSLGSAGFLWFAEADGSSVELARTRGTDASLAPGASTDEIIIINAVAPGTATIRLTQRRPWEGGDAAHDQARIGVTVLPES
jgi:predicted secreted protein